METRSRQRLSVPSHSARLSRIPRYGRLWRTRPKMRLTFFQSVKFVYLFFSTFFRYFFGYCEEPVPSLRNKSIVIFIMRHNSQRKRLHTLALENIWIITLLLYLLLSYVYLYCSDYKMEKFPRGTAFYSRNDYEQSNDTFFFLGNCRFMKKI